MWHVAPGERNTQWLGTAISHLQLNLEYSVDIFQVSQGVSTQDISGLAKSGQVGSALLIRMRGAGAEALECSGEKPRTWADSVGILSHTYAGVKPHYQARGSQPLLWLWP